MAHKARQSIDGYLFFQSWLWTFMTERLETTDKTWLALIIFLLFIKQKLPSMHIFPKLLQLHKNVE